MLNSLDRGKNLRTDISFTNKLKQYSLQQKYTNTLPYLVVSCDFEIRKDDYFLYIKKDKYDLTSLTIKDVISLLNTHEADVKYIKRDDYLYLPSIFLCDILTKTIEVNTVTKSPFKYSDLHSEEPKGLRIISEEVDLNFVFDPTTNKKLNIKEKKGKIFIEDPFKVSSVYFTKNIKNFIWDLNLNNIITNNKTLAGKLLEK